ncbi:unnamed protein product [Gordionus sp. m RMFG-2023]
MGNSRFCYSFLVRDTPDDFINVTYWGSSETNDTASSRFKIGDLVDILCAEIEPKTENFTEFKYKPWTPVWEEAIIDWVMKWKFDIPLMLFASDLQLKFNTFRKAYVLNTTHKTVFTFDPDIPEYRDKYLNLIKEGSLVNVHMFMEDEDDEIVTDISKFVEIPTVIQLISIVDKRFEDSSLINQSDLRESDTSPKWDKFYCVLRAHVSNFDIDTELMEKVIAWKCQICNCKINEIKLKKLFLQKNENGRRASVMKKLCTNIKCQSYKSFEQIKGLKIDANDDIDSDVYPIYNIKMNISDYTGTLVNCGIVSTKTRSLIDLKVIKR